VFTVYVFTLHGIRTPSPLTNSRDGLGTKKKKKKKKCRNRREIVSDICFRIIKILPGQHRRLTNATHRRMTLEEGCPNGATLNKEGSASDLISPMTLEEEGGASAAAQADGQTPDEEALRWAAVPREHLIRLILEQLPRFRSRLYIDGDSALAELINCGLLEHMPGDYSWSLCFEAPFISRLCREGFLPICCELGGGTAPGLYVLLPKLHIQRCILRHGDMHISKKVRKRAPRYRLTVCQAFDEVMQQCIEQHGMAWLYPPMQRVLSQLAAPATLDGLEACSPRFVSFELWTRPEPSGGGGDAMEKAPQLVAGDLGCVVGSSYTSFSGFHIGDGTGSIQMALTGMLLERAGFGWWDLGQEHGYKAVLGAKPVPRAEFIDTFRQLRGVPNRLRELVGAGGDATEASALR